MGITYCISVKNVYFDINIFIYAFEGFPQYRQTVLTLFEAIDRGVFTAYTSEPTLAELLVKPLADKNNNLSDIYHEYLTSSQGLSLLPVSRETLLNAARLRADNSALIKLPDAIHLVTAINQGCKTFITNDKRLKRFPDIQVLVQEDLQDT